MGTNFVKKCSRPNGVRSDKDMKLGSINRLAREDMVEE